MNNDVFFKEIAQINLDEFRNYIEKLGFESSEENEKRFHYSMDEDLIIIPIANAYDDSDVRAMLLSDLRVIAKKTGKGYIEIMRDLNII